MWKGTFTIDGKPFSSNFYVCKGISHDVILGNTFLKKFQASIDYSSLKVTFLLEGERVTVPFGKFYTPAPFSNVFSDMDTDALSTGPRFIRAQRKVSIPPNTISWIKVHSPSCKLRGDPIFVGNPALKRNCALAVFDFVLAPQKEHYIQVANLSSKTKFVQPKMNLAVDAANEDVFYGYSEPIHAIRSTANAAQNSAFKINSELTPEQRVQAEELLQSFRDVFVSDVSELRRCKYPPIFIDYDQSKTVRQQNYRMSPDEKNFAEAYIEKLLKADLIEYCTSMYCTPILVVPKPSHNPNGEPSFRLVQDFRKVNKLLKDLRYPVADRTRTNRQFSGKVLAFRN